MKTINQLSSSGMRTEPMSRHAVFALAKSPIHAVRIVDQLKTASFPDEAISTLLTDPRMSWPFDQKRNHHKAFEGAVAGTGTGVIIGVAWGWIAGVGALTIPGVGLFLAAGPVVAAMSGASIGAALGSVFGGLIGMGIPETEARAYEGKILKGDILLSVHAEEHKDIHRAKEIFDGSRADDIWATNPLHSC